MWRRAARIGWLTAFVAAILLAGGDSPSERLLLVFDLNPELAVRMRDEARPTELALGPQVVGQEVRERINGDHPSA